MKALHFYYLCCKHTEYMMDTYYETEHFVEAYYPDFTKRKPSGIEGTFYDFIELSTDAIGEIRERALDRLENCLSDMWELDSSERRFCMEEIPFEDTLKNGFVSKYFKAIDLACPYGSFEEYCEELRNLLMTMDENENIYEH